MTPPFAVPSSFVSTMPVTPARLREHRAPGRSRSGRSSRRARAASRGARPGTPWPIDARDLLELLHEGCLRVEAARGVDDHDVDARATARSRPRRTTTAAGSPPSAPTITSQPARSPQTLELLDAPRRGTCRLRRAHLLAVGAIARGELADRRRLADAVHAEHDDHVGPRHGRERFAARLHAAQLLRDRAAQRRAHLVGTAARSLLLQAREQVLGRLHAEVCGEQQRLELALELRVEGAPARELERATDQRGLGAREPLAQGDAHRRCWSCRLCRFSLGRGSDGPRNWLRRHGRRLRLAGRRFRRSRRRLLPRARESERGERS